MPSLCYKETAKFPFGAFEERDNFSTLDIGGVTMIKYGSHI